MLYFIPAWYRQDDWCENEQSWHVRRLHTEFDDTVKQMQLFHRSGAYPYQILLLSYAPNFRHFLHRQSVFHAPYWSCFDAIQQIQKKKIVPFSFHDLNWPQGIEFVYSPFVVLAFFRGEKYAKVEFGEDGNPIYVDLYREGRMIRRNLYDDRGFVSSTILYEDEKPIYQDYLAQDGVWKLRRYFGDGHVEVNPERPEYSLPYQDAERKKKFLKPAYGGIEEVIQEVFAGYLRLTKKEDIFCAAMHERHTALLGRTLKNRNVILSFFADRYPHPLQPAERRAKGKPAPADAAEMVRTAGHIVADSAENKKRIVKWYGASLDRITVIPPYDTRADSGISGRLRVQKILVPVDGMGEGELDSLIEALGRYLLKNEIAEIHLFTRDADFNIKNRLMDRTKDILKKTGLKEGWAESSESIVTAENDLEELAKVPVRFFAEQCVDELAVSTCMREQRLLVDMRKAPEQYLQIMALSLGIPQIVCKDTAFVKNGKNGIVLENTKDLAWAMHYYLDGLTHWNEAKVHSYELGRKFTTDRLLKKWGKVMLSVGKDSYTAAGRGRLERDL